MDGFFPRDEEAEHGMAARANEGPLSETLTLRIERELLEAARRKAESLQMDVSTFVRWCIQTGVVLGDLNSFIRTRIVESP